MFVLSLLRGFFKKKFYTMAIDKLKVIKGKYGCLGLYVLQSIEMRIIASKSLRMETSRDIIYNFSKDILFGDFGDMDINSDNYLFDKVARHIISDALLSGYIVINKIKDKSYIIMPHIKKKPSAVSKKTSAPVLSGKGKPSSVDEVLAYMITKSEYSTPVLAKEANEFYDYWQERGWKRGSVQIKDWKATANRWLRSDYRQAKTDVSTNQSEL
jgi:hypothetical protein